MGKNTCKTKQRLSTVISLLFIISLLMPISLRAAVEEAEPPAAQEKTDDVPVNGPSAPGIKDASAAAVVATVGDVEITEADLQEVVLQKVKTTYSHGQDLARKPEYRSNALDELIELELFAHAAQQEGMKAPEAYLDKVVEQNISKLGSEKAFHEVLRRRGITLDSFRSRAGRVWMANELLMKTFSESAYSEDELKKHYEKHIESFRRPESMRLFEILLKVDPSAPEEEWKRKQEQAEALLKRLGSGEEFYDIAYQNSEDEYRVKGGDHGFVHTELLTPDELRGPAAALKPGEVSSVIRTIQGFYILKAGERKPGELLEFSKVKDELANSLQMKRFEEKKNAILMKMRDAYPVKIHATFGENP